MLAAHTAPDPRDLYTISAGGFSATADAFARDPDTEGLWFLSMVGPQTALKAIWAALLKQPADAAHTARPDGRRDPLGRLSPLFDSPGDRGHLGNQDRPPARLGRLARVGLHPDGRARLRAGLVPAAGSVREGGARHPPAFPRPAQPAPTAPLLGGLAVVAGPGGGRDRDAAVGWRRRLPVQAQRRCAPRGPLPGGGVGTADAAAGGHRSTIDHDRYGR